MRMVLRFLGTVAAILLTVYIVPGIYVTEGWLTILLAALVWSVITLLIKPILSILTLPITILTLYFRAHHQCASLLGNDADRSRIFRRRVLGRASRCHRPLILSWLIHMLLEHETTSLRSCSDIVRVGSNGSEPN